MQPKRMKAMRAKVFAVSKGERFPVKVIHDGQDFRETDLQKREIVFHVTSKTPRAWIKAEAISQAKGFTYTYNETLRKEISFLIDSKPKEWAKIRKENEGLGILMTGAVMDRLRAAKG